MPLIQYCPDCWAENLIGAAACDQCGASLSETDVILYDQKLMRALHYSVPETREMAARLLGHRRDKQALPVLLSRLLAETDMGVVCSIGKALGQLGDCQAVAALVKRLAQPDVLIVKLTIVDALATLAQMGCWEALDALKVPPPVPERVACEITIRLEMLNSLYY